MSHKRKLSHHESPPVKRPNQAAVDSTDPPKAACQFVYSFIEEKFNEHGVTKQTAFEIYATVEDANSRLLARLSEFPAMDLEEWETTCDKYGCIHSVAEDPEVNGIDLRVRRMEVKPPGSAPAVPVALNMGLHQHFYDEEDEEKEEEDEDGEEEEDDDEGGEELHTRKPARTWTKRISPSSDCDGCGCGSCQNCLSMGDF